MGTLRSLDESARRRFEIGMGGMEDVFRLQAEEARLRTDSLGLVGGERNARLMLCAYLGDSSQIEISPSIEFDDNASNIPSLDSMLTLAQNRPERKSMSSATRMAESEATSTRLRKLPDFMLQGRYMTMMGPDEFSVMLGVKVPIAPWSSAETRQAEIAAKTRIQEAAFREKNMSIMLAQEAREAMNQYETARQSLRQIQQNQVGAALNAMGASQTSYGSGKGDLSMTIDAMRMLLMAKEDEVMAKVSLFQALLNTEKASGQNPDAWLVETTGSIKSNP